MAKKFGKILLLSAAAGAAGMLAYRYMKKKDAELISGMDEDFDDFSLDDDEEDDSCTYIPLNHENSSSADVAEDTAPNTTGEAAADFVDNAAAAVSDAASEAADATADFVDNAAAAVSDAASEAAEAAADITKSDLSDTPKDLFTPLGDTLSGENKTPEEVADSVEDFFDDAEDDNE